MSTGLVLELEINAPLPKRLPTAHTDGELVSQADTKPKGCSSAVAMREVISLQISRASNAPQSQVCVSNEHYSLTNLGNLEASRRRGAAVLLSQ